MEVLYNKEKQKVPVKLWTPIHKVESQALDQLKTTASLPFVFKHIAAMPDVHLGKGATVGSVIATRNAVMPAAVGVDIGCGMMAVKTNLEVGPVRDAIADIRKKIEERIPVSHHGNKTLSPIVKHWGGWTDWETTVFGEDNNLLNKAISQLGSLGGGNHFIEICIDEKENVWVMLHSGSRNVGKTLADRHINSAKGIMKKYMISLPDPDLAYFVEGTPEFVQYWSDLQWAQKYAWKNREVMMDRVLKILEPFPNKNKSGSVYSTIHCHHNYAEKEHHFGKNVIITRKGAVRARIGDLGIIPGSMGTKSYIVTGLGSDESFHSCSHGAGRRMSRSQAKKTFTLDDLKKQTSGVECRKDTAVIDEIPSSYKDIDEVMANQTDLVQVVATLKQIMCVKG